MRGGNAVLVSRHDSGPGKNSTEVSLWDSDTGRNRSKVLIEGTWYAELPSPDGRRFLARSTARHYGKWPLGLPLPEPGPSFVFDTTTGRKLYQLAETRPSDWHKYGISPDSRTLVIGQDDGQLLLIEAATGGERIRFRHVGGIKSLHFTPDGRWLAADSPGELVLVWDIRGELDWPDTPPDDANLERAWVALALDDAKLSFAAVRLLAAFPDRSVAFLRGKVASVAVPDPKRLHGLVMALDNPAFAEREKATAELARFGANAEAVLRDTVQSAGSAEVRRRAGYLLDRIMAQKLTPDELRAVRVVEAVEWMGTPDAVKLLETWAGGAAAAQLTEEAKTALVRLKR
jgi:hypothetical protein